MKIYYIANARMPNEKAHGIQIAKTCESFIEAGRDVELIVPARKGASDDIQSFYGLRVPVPTRILPVLDWYTGGPVGFALASCSFMLAAVQFLRRQRAHGEACVAYTVDMDSFSGVFLRFAGVPYLSEMHGVKQKNFITAAFFRSLAGVIAINTLIRDDLMRTFGLPAERFLVEGNAVDQVQLAETRTRDAARAELGLSPAERIALYVGRLYGWKELGILAEAARSLPDACIYFVGGSRAGYEQLTGAAAPENLRFVEEVASYAVPAWLAAADVLVVLGSAQNPASYKYTSPMKVYEYLAAERTIVASRTPALQEIVTDAEAYFYDPDDASALAEAIRAAFADTNRAAAARALAEKHTWSARAARILAFIDRVAKLPSNE